MPVPFVSIPAAVLFFRYREGRIGRERNRYFINQYLYLYLIALDFPTSDYPVSENPISDGSCCVLLGKSP
mgnify:CR=1 FL=1